MPDGFLDLEEIIKYWEHMLNKVQRGRQTEVSVKSERLILSTLHYLYVLKEV